MKNSAISSCRQAIHRQRQPLLLPLLLVMATPLAQAAMSSYKAEFARSSAGAVMAMDFPAPVKYKVFGLSEPNRLVIDLDEVASGPALDRLASQLFSGDPDVADIRIGHPTATSTRIVLDLKGGLPKVDASVEAGANGGQRLLLKWLSSGTRVAQAGAASAPAMTDAVPQRAADSTAPAAAGKPADPGREWMYNITPQLVYGTYKKSLSRKNFLSTGAAFDAQYLERGGVAVAATHTNLNYKDGSPTLRQNAVFFSARANYTPDGLPGNVTLRGDIHQINNNDPTNETDKVRAFAPQLSYLSFDKSQYFDLGYAYSRYGDSNAGNPSLKVRQLTPTAGYGFNAGSDWLQVRLYDIRFDRSVRTQNKSGTDAIEVKWTHFMTPRSYMPEKFQISALLGERMYAVDGDSASVFNLADLQRGGISATAQWSLAPRLTLQLNGGYNRYQAMSVTGLTNDYSATHLYTGVNVEW